MAWNKDKHLELRLMAGILTVRNIGVRITDSDIASVVASAWRRPAAYPTAEDVTLVLAGGYIEDEAMEKTFTQEARSWRASLNKMGQTKSQETWPDVWAQVQQPKES